MSKIYGLPKELEWHAGSSDKDKDVLYCHARNCVWLRIEPDHLNEGKFRIAVHQQVLEYISESSLPNFDSVDEAKEHAQKIFNDYWKELSEIVII